MLLPPQDSPRLSEFFPLAQACSSCSPHSAPTIIENQIFIKILFFLTQIPLLIQNKILPLPIINESQTKQLLFYG